MPMLVLDRNVIRRTDLTDAATDAATEFVLTDTFFVEMVKNPEYWIKTFKRDFAELRQIGDRFRISLSVGECLRKEISEGRSITREELLPPEFQLLFARLLGSSRNDPDPSSDVLQDIADILPALKAEQPPQNVPKESLEDLTRKLTACLPPEILSDLRNGSLHGDAMLGLVQYVGRRAYEAYCVEKHKTLLSQPESMTGRYFFNQVFRVISWLQRGGLDTAAPGKLHNDAYDDEYVLLGSFFDGVLSLERRVNEADVALRRIVESASSNDLLTAFRRYRAERCEGPAA